VFGPRHETHDGPRTILLIGHSIPQAFVSHLCDLRENFARPSVVFRHHGRWNGACQFLFLKGESQCEVSYADRKGKYMYQRGVTLPRVE
jgi:hypothetical protein